MICPVYVLARHQPICSCHQDFQDLPPVSSSVHHKRRLGLHPTEGRPSPEDCPLPTLSDPFDSAVDSIVPRLSSVQSSPNLRHSLGNISRTLPHNSPASQEPTLFESERFFIIGEFRPFPLLRCHCAIGINFLGRYCSNVWENSCRPRTVDKLSGYGILFHG